MREPSMTTSRATSHADSMEVYSTIDWIQLLNASNVPQFDQRAHVLGGVC